MEPWLTPVAHRRLLRVWLLFATGALAVVAGGVAAAAIAYTPTQQLIWMSAYLVLVAGVAQCILGLAQALLPGDPPLQGWVTGEWALFNVGNAAVIIGTLLGWSGMVTAGTILFVLALVMFLFGVRGAARSWLTHAFRACVLVSCVGACTGLGLSLAGLAH